MLWRKIKQRKVDQECYERSVILNTVAGLSLTEKAPKSEPCREN